MLIFVWLALINRVLVKAEHTTDAQFEELFYKPRYFKIRKSQRR